MGRIIEAKAIITAEDRASAVIAKIGKAMAQIGQAMTRTGVAAKAASAVDSTSAAMKRADVAAKGYTKAAQEAARATTSLKQARAEFAVGPTRYSLSEGLRQDLAAMRLTRAESIRLGREIVTMRKAQDRALGSIGNPRVREQALKADLAVIEGKVRARARDLVAERAFQGEMAALAIDSTTRTTKRVADEKDRAARAENERRQRAEREAARDKLLAAREAARTARVAEREAERTANHEARQRASSARAAALASRAEAREAVANLRAEARTKAQAEREQGRFRREGGRHLREAATLAGLGGAGYGTERAVHRGGEVARDRQIETARASAVGMSPEHMAIGEKRAYELSQQFPSLDPTELREHYRALHVNLAGNAEAARDTLEPVARAQVMLQNFRGREAAQADLARIIRGAENAGFSDDPKKFANYLSGATKGMQLFGDTLRGEDYYQYSKVGKMAVPGLSDRFLGAIVPSIIDDMGGPSAGAAHMTAYGAVVGGRMKKSAKAAAASYGLMGKDGRMIERDLFQSDPLEWATKVLEPHLAKKGAGYDPANPQKFTDALATVFSDRNAADFVGKLITKQGELRRNEERFKVVKDLDQAEGVRRDNPSVSYQGATTQVSNLLGDLITPMVAPATVALNALADAAGSASAKLRGEPEVAKGAVPAAAVVGGSVAAVMAGRAAQAVAGEATGLTASALRLGGRTLVGMGSVAPWLALPAGAAGGAVLDGQMSGAFGGSSKEAIREMRQRRRQAQQDKTNEGLTRGLPYPASFGQTVAPMGDETAPVTTPVTTSRGFWGDFLWGEAKDNQALPTFGFRVPGAPTPGEPPRRPMELGGTQSPAVGASVVAPSALPSPLPVSIVGVPTPPAASGLPSPAGTPAGPLEVRIPEGSVTARVTEIAPVTGSVTETVTHQHQHTISLNTEMLRAEIRSVASQTMKTIPLTGAGTRPGAISMPGAVAPPGSK